MKVWSTFFLLQILLTSTVGAQEVWPGDVNDNGVVNGVDILFLGLAFGNSGPERDDADTDWEAQPITEFWGQSFPNGLDYAYGDCNGDGVIDDDDIKEVIIENFGEINLPIIPDGYENGTAGSAPPIFLESSSMAVMPGETITIDLILGDDNFPISNFSGITLAMSYSADLIESDDDDDDDDNDETNFDFELVNDSWIGNGENEVEQLLYKNSSEGLAELSITRIDQNIVNEGSGTIGQFSIVIEDIIVGAVEDTFRITIDSIFLMDDQLNVTPIVPDTIDILVRDEMTTTSRDEALKKADVKVFPNPSNNSFTITSDQKIISLNIYNPMGHVMPLEKTLRGANSYQIHPVNWPDGVYFLEMSTLNQVIIKKLFLKSN